MTSYKVSIITFALGRIV